MSKEIDHDWTDRPVCPYCGHEHEVESPDDWNGKHECYECGKSFFCEPSYSVNYTTAQVPCWNGAEHELKKSGGWIDEVGKKAPWYCRMCNDTFWIEVKE